MITSALMGFGHLRAAHNLSSFGHMPVLRVDREPYVNFVDRLVWGMGQYSHTYASRDAESRSKFLYTRFEKLMTIPKDHEKPPLGPSRFIRTIERFGAGKELFRQLGEDNPRLIHTFYLPAMLSVYREYPGKSFLLLCDTDFHRVWAPLEPENGPLEYCVPISKSADRLISYGVKSEKIHVTGFPLPPVHTGVGETVTAENDFEVRRTRLQTNSSLPLTIMFPFSGAGAYSNVLAEMVKSILDELQEGTLRLVVSCGDNEEALWNAENLFTNYGIDELEYVEIIYDADLFNSFERFNLALKSSDVVVTKPSEMVFYAALGIPMIFLPPIGAHEARNREYLLESGCASDMISIPDFAKWLFEARRSGLLLELAENGFRKLSREGADKINEIVSGA